MPLSLNRSIRRAVASGEFARAAGLWEEYTVECRDHMRPDADASAKLEEARELMVWCRQMALAARAQAQQQFDTLARSSLVESAYGPPAAPSPGSIRARY